MKDINSNNNKKLYEAYPIIKEIDKDNNGIILKNAIYKHMDADEYLSTYGGGCSGFIFVISGNIKIQRINKEGGETNLYDIGRGQLCHEALTCFVESKPLNILGRATQASIISVVPFEVVDKYLLSNLRFLKYVYKDLHDKFNLVIGAKDEIKHESLRKRLVKLLKKNTGNIVYTTHSQLAFELDSAREVISRKLKELEKEGYVKVTRGKIVILKDLDEIE